MLEVFTRQRYPVTTILRDGSPVRIRPLKAEDREAFTRFFEQMPLDDLVNMERNPRSPDTIREWLEGCEKQQILILVAEDETGRIVGESLVYQTLRGWKSHQGRIRVTVLPEWRRKALASRLVQEMMQMALNSGLDLLIAEFIPEQVSAMNTFSRNGYVKLAQIPQYVRDLSGRDHDLILMGRHIREQEYFAGD